MDLKTTFLRAEAAIAEGDKHLFRLEKAFVVLQGLFPLSVNSLNSMDDDSVALMDQFIYRFTKLQDCMGSRLFSAMYSLSNETGEAVPFLDLLHRLEKLGVIESAIEWMELRNLRNELAHEYPDSEQQQVEALNNLFESFSVLKKIYTQAKLFYFNKLKPLL